MDDSGREGLPAWGEGPPRKLLGRSSNTAAIVDSSRSSRKCSARMRAWIRLVMTSRYVLGSPVGLPYVWATPPRTTTAPPGPRAVVLIVRGDHERARQHIPRLVSS